jgi:hypothetical protein
MRIAVYVTFERMYGVRSTRTELREDLKQFAIDPSIQNDLVSLFFTQEEISQMKALEPHHYPVLLHRQQLLFLMKEALRVCPESGIILKDDLKPLARALLRANDLLAHVLPAPKNFRDRCLRALAHSFSVQEANSFHSWEYKALRSYWMLKRTLPELSHQQSFYDVPELFCAHGTQSAHFPDS